ncbi:hypothetical protein PVAND_008648 [Polypedilum vanderplanki]|uniref:BZIP domain-containing protein n=1 Tax=Polypedilum vanderplanki TaxID=319348 RepID=A0A9J6CBD3_POLVA|nr:hypothetical protein PVAND_008648 [Polypedilum vanderplanki]
MSPPKNPNDPKHKQSREKNNEAVRKHREKRRNEIKKIEDAIEHYKAENYILQGKIDMQRDFIKSMLNDTKNLSLSAEEQTFLNAIDDELKAEDLNEF